MSRERQQSQPKMIRAQNATGDTSMTEVEDSHDSAVGRRSPSQSWQLMVQVAVSTAPLHFDEVGHLQEEDLG